MALLTSASSTLLELFVALPLCVSSTKPIIQRSGLTSAINICCEMMVCSVHKARQTVLPVVVFSAEEKAARVFRTFHGLVAWWHRTHLEWWVFLKLKSKKKHFACQNYLLSLNVHVEHDGFARFLVVLTLVSVTLLCIQCPESVNGPLFLHSRQAGKWLWFGKTDIVWPSAHYG